MMGQIPKIQNDFYSQAKNSELINNVLAIFDRFWFVPHPWAEPRIPFIHP